MPNRPSALQSPIIAIGDTSGNLVSQDEIVARITNMRQTPEGGLISVDSPMEYMPSPVAYAFTQTKGIFHCRLSNGRDILLVHDGGYIVAQHGWDRTWYTLIGPYAGTYGVAQEFADLPPDDLLSYPTQFVQTPNGVVIIPAGGRAYFYDGEFCAKLGYDYVPSPPTGVGPANSDNEYDGTKTYGGFNDIGYAVDSLTGRFTAMSNVFRRGRIGTIQTPGNTIADSTGVSDSSDPVHVMGWLKPGRWRASVQMVDRWGNLSPQSGHSNDVKMERQPSTGWKAVATSYWINAESVCKQIAWDAIPLGQRGTRGRILFRSMDITNTGDDTMWELPLNSMAVLSSFATLPDNISKTYPDNIPDEWLGAPAEEVDPVPMFRLGCMAMGRMWIGNWEGGEGAIRPSLVGLWGTFPTGQTLWPDPRGAEITGMHAVGNGMLVYTSRSTFLVSPNSDGDGFRRQTLSTTVGCVAPSSVVTIGNGVVVWLGYDGFYAYDGSNVSPIFEDWQSESKQFVGARMRRACAYWDARHREYRCCLPSSGSVDNDLMCCYDGTRWTFRNDIQATGMCLSDDPRELGIACGKVGGVDSVWVLDRGSGAYEAAELKTGWIRSTNSLSRSSIRSVRVWMRETGTDDTDAGKIQVSISRDFRAEEVSSAVVQRFADVDSEYGAAGNPSFYTQGELWNSALWRTRRPYWSHVDIDVPACETFRMTLSCMGRMEILGFQFEEIPRSDGHARLP